MTHVSNPEIDLAPEPEKLAETEPGGTVVKSEPKPIAQPNQGALVTGDDTADLLRLAVEKGTPVEQLTALVDLRERMEARQARREYFAALKAFQEEYATDPVVKSRKADIASGRGADYAYKYANVDDVARHIGPMLMRHGLSHKWDSKVEGPLLTCTTTVMHVGGHSESSNFSVPTENKAGMSPQQKVGSAMSYAQARGLANALGITITDEDPTQTGVVDPMPIDDDQIAEIQDIVAEKGIDVRRVLKFAKVDKVADIRKGDYLRVVAALDEVGKGMKPKAGGQ